MEDIKDINEIIEHIKKKATVEELESTNLDFPSLDASIPFSRKNAVKPIYFIPTMNTDHSNILAYNNNEPFSYIAIPQSKYHLSLMREARYLDDLLELIKNQCSVMIADNVSIIFNNDIIYTLKESIIDKEFYNIYNLDLVGNGYNIATGTIYNITYQLRDAYIKNKMNDCASLLATMITKVKNDLAKSFSNRAHLFSLEILNRKLVDIDKLYKIFSKNMIICDELKPDKYSLCMQALHMIFAKSIEKICDIAELALVGAFYQLTDALADAKRLGVNNNDQITRHINEDDEPF